MSEWEGACQSGRGLSSNQSSLLGLQRTLLALETNRASVLMGGLDFSPEHGQKTLIITNSVEEVEQVFRVRTLKR